jgi:DNA-directed RNA polymerase alpha subunit
VSVRDEERSMTQLIRCPHCGKPVDVAMAKAAAKKAKAESLRVAKALVISVDEVGWSTRVRNILANGIETYRNGGRVGIPIHTLGDLCALTEMDLYRADACGKVTIAEIRATLAEHGLMLGMYSGEMAPVDYGIPATVDEAKAQVKAWADEDREWEARGDNPTFL